MIMKLFFIFLLAQFVISTNEACFEFSPEGDLLFKRGEEMLFRCSIKANGNCAHYSITNIVIKKGSGPVSPVFTVYNKDEKAVEIKIPSATFGNAGTYICGNRTADGTRSAVKEVHVGEPPSAPEKLRCLSRQFKDMICSFLMNETEYNIPTVWKMELILSQNWTTIPKSNCNNSNHTCWLNSATNTPSSFTFRHSMSYQVRVFVWNRLGNATTNITIADTSGIVQPGPVESFTYNYTTASKNVVLQWKIPVAPEYNLMLDYKILISSEFDNRTLVMTNRTAVYEKYSLVDLIPFLQYSVSVYARPSTARLDMYWSTAATLKFVTKTAIPLHTVAMTAGSYVLLDCGQRDMCIVIYWKNPQERYRHGLITGYNVTIRKYCFEETTSMLMTKLPCNDQGDLESSSEVINIMAVYGPLKTKMLKENNYLVEVMVKNSKGVSRNHSEQMIPNWNTGKARIPIWVVAELTNDSAFISWQMDPKFCSAVTSVTYYWCSEVVDGPLNSFYVSCKDGFDWTKLDIKDGCEAYKGHSIYRPIDSLGVRYAVSVETHKVSGSLKWENFRFQKNNVPEKPLYRASADGTALKVHIQYRDFHQSQGGKPDNYTIMYERCVSATVCPSDVSSSRNETFPVDFLKHEYIVDNIEPGTMYKVQVVALNDAGGSARGKAVMVTVPEDFKVKVVEIVVGTLTSVMCLALVLLCCLGKRWYRKTREKMTITVPAADADDSDIASSRLEQLRQGSSNCEESLSSTRSTDLLSNPQNEDFKRNSQDMMDHIETANDAFLGIGEIMSQRDDENVDHNRAEVFINNDLVNSCSVPFTDMNPVMTYDMKDSTNVNASCATTTDTRERDATVFLLKQGNELSSLNLQTCKPFENAHLSHDNDEKNKQLTTQQTPCYSGYVDANNAVNAVHSIAMSHTNSIADTVYAIGVPNANSYVDAVHAIAEPNANSSFYIAHAIAVPIANSTVDAVDVTGVPRANSTVDAIHSIAVPNTNSTINAVNVIAEPYANNSVDAVYAIAVPNTNSTVDAVHAKAKPNTDISEDAVHAIAVTY